MNKERESKSEAKTPIGSLLSVLNEVPNDEWKEEKLDLEFPRVKDRSFSTEMSVHFHTGKERQVKFTLTHIGEGSGDPFKNITPGFSLTIEDNQTLDPYGDPVKIKSQIDYDSNEANQIDRLMGKLDRMTKEKNEKRKEELELELIYDMCEFINKDK